MKIALAQINPTIGDFDANLARIREFAAQGSAGGAELVLFPELSLCGYPPRDLVDKPSFVESNARGLGVVARDFPDLDIICGFVSRAAAGSGRRVANSAALLSGGRIRFVQSKMLLPTYDVFDELRYFEPASQQRVVELSGKKWGITICEDIWNDKTYWKTQRYSRDPVEELISQGAEILVNLSASPFLDGKRELREEMLRTLALRHRIPVIFVNQVGGNDSLIFDGTSTVIDRQGQVRALARSFEEDLVFFDTTYGQGDIHPSTRDPVESIYRALVVGIRDYVAKCGFQSVLIGLSGGIDSALTAALAVEALGSDHVRGVAMAGPYSSPSSLADAEALAVNLRIPLDQIPITEIFQSYQHTLQPVFSGLRPGVAEENVQARIRGNLLMALSNKFGSLVLSTGNKSELAVGYCTLYGDMAGGLAAISDVPKTMVYRLAGFVNRDEIIIPRSTMEKPPSAELRPGQKDTDSLPPYEILDVILKAYIEDHLTPRQIAAGNDFPLELVRGITAKVDGNEYKRQQAAPGLKVTSKAFGIGRRFPIAQRYRER